MKNNQVIPYGCNIISAVATALQTNEMLQNIQAVLTIIAFIVSIAFSIYHWYKEASKDGKITKDEVDDLADDIKDKVDDFKNKNNKEDK